MAGPGYTKQLGIRCDEETINRCIRAGAGRGEVAGARALMALGWPRFLEEVAAGLPVADRLRAIAVEVEQLEQRPHAIATSSGAALLHAPTGERIAQLRKQARPGLIATPTGFLAYGQDTVGNESVLTVDQENGELGMANSDGEEVKQPLDLPTAASLAGMFSRAVTAAHEQAAQGRSPRKAEPITHRGLGLTVWAAHPDDGHARIQLGGLEQRIHGLVLLQLVAELHALVARATAEQLQIRQGLEQLMAAPDTKAPALAWERSHGEG